MLGKHVLRERVRHGGVLAVHEPSAHGDFAFLGHGGHLVDECLSRSRGQLAFLFRCFLVHFFKCHALLCF